MKRELIIKKCMECHSLIKNIGESNNNIVCCHKEMQVVIPNDSDASYEKHVPMYELKDGKLRVSVNHVMEKEHFIEWICLLTNDAEKFIYFKPHNQAVVEFDNVLSGTLYSYCNKHGLWKSDI